MCHWGLPSVRPSWHSDNTPSSSSSLRAFNSARAPPAALKWPLYLVHQIACLHVFLPLCHFLVSLTQWLHLLGEGDAVSTIKGHPDLSDPLSTTVSRGPSVFPLWVQLLLFSDLPDKSHSSTSIHPFFITNTSMTDPLYRKTHNTQQKRVWCHWAGRKVLAEISSLTGDRRKNFREIHQHFSLPNWQGRNGLRLTKLRLYVREFSENWGSACWVS